VLQKTYRDSLTSVSSKDGFGGNFLIFDLALSMRAFAIDPAVLGVAGGCMFSFSAEE